ncbi:MAG: alpha/beta fold hydrolase [Solirubrobacteraceae bacterium]|nr:alpha/beta fold hydrolase [Solirubrobacteraceae bacterium]
MQFDRRGSGPPLLLVHGLGGNRHSFDPITDDLALEREIIAPDLPGFGRTPPLDGPVTITTLADALEAFLVEHDLDGVDCVGTSMGARLVLELARRKRVGATVALDPGGFWNDREVKVFGASIGTSIKLIRALRPLLPVLVRNPVSRTALFAQFSARPWALPSEVVLNEMRAYVDAPSFDDALEGLVKGPRQGGIPAGESRGPILIGWGRRDLVTLTRQAKRAAEAFPDATIHWFEHSGHLPQWDEPEAATRLILEWTGGRNVSTP